MIKYHQDFISPMLWLMGHQHVIKYPFAESLLDRYILTKKVSPWNEIFVLFWWLFDKIIIIRSNGDKFYVLWTMRTTSPRDWKRIELSQRSSQAVKKRETAEIKIRTKYLKNFIKVLLASHALQSKYWCINALDTNIKRNSYLQRNFIYEPFYYYIFTNKGFLCVFADKIWLLV